MKILHFADIHARDNDIDEIRKCLDFIVDQAPGSDLIICAGDVFDSANVRLDSRAAKMIFDVFSRLADIAPVAVIAGTPSHEGNACEVLGYIRARHNVLTSIKPEQIYLYQYADSWLINKEAYGDSSMLLPEAVKAVLTMIPAPTKQYFISSGSDIKGTDNEIAQAMASMFTGFAAEAAVFDAPHILVGHWNVSGSLVSETQTLTGVDIELSKEQMALANADLICLGHIHKSQKIQPNIFFPGSTQTNTWGELDPKGFYLHTINADIGIARPDYWVESEFIKTPSRKMVRFDHNYTKEGGFEEFDISDFSASPDTIKGSLVRLDVKVHQDESEKIDRQATKDFFLSMGALDVDLNIIRIPRINVRSKKIMDLERLRDKLIERARLIDQEVAESVLSKADALESDPPDRILGTIYAK